MDIGGIGNSACSKIGQKLKFSGFNNNLILIHLYLM
jgi:hypothetical protein